MTQPASTPNPRRSDDAVVARSEAGAVLERHLRNETAAFTEFTKRLLNITATLSDALADIAIIPDVPQSVIDTALNGLRDARAQQAAALDAFNASAPNTTATR